MQFFRLRSARKRKEAMNRQEAIVAWVGIDWADESHQVCEYEVQTGNKQIYAVEQNAESLQEWDQSTANPIRRRKTNRRCAGAGTRRIDLCTDEHGLHRNLSGESAVI